MNGSYSIRGYLVQTMLSILDALQTESIWVAIALEPKHESEKVDIKWWFQATTKVVQVKSSKNPFKKSDVTSWCQELKDSTQADIYELLLVGQCPPAVGELGEFQGVRILPPKNLDIDGMIAEIAHRLAVFAESRNIPLAAGSKCELLANALVTKLEIYSTEGKRLTRSDFETCITRWILLLVQEVNYDSSESLEVISNVKVTEPERWILVLEVRKLAPIANGWPMQTYALQDLLSKPNEKAVLVGKNGSGKTSAMRLAAYTLTHIAQKLCFWIPLKDYTGNLESTVKKLLGWHELPEDRVIPTLQKHQVILLFDGLDEVPYGLREQCAAQVAQMIRSYQGQLCVSYAVADHSYYSFGCPTYEIVPLTDSQIHQVTEAYFDEVGDATKAKRFFDRLSTWSKEEKVGFYVLAQMPINLRFLLELADSDDIGYGSQDLFGRVIQMRLSRMEKREKKGQISVETKTRCLEDLAIRSIVDDRSLRMPKAYVEEIFSIHLSRSDAFMAVQEVIRNGLLQEINNFTLEWPHSSFRDYLAGRCIFKTVQLREPLDKFPLDKPTAIAAVAHAVRLSTTQPMEWIDRPQVFLSLLKKNASFEAVHTAAMEYNLSTEDIGHNDLKSACVAYQRFQWGGKVYRGVSVDSKHGSPRRLPQCYKNSKSARIGSLFQLYFRLLFDDIFGY